MKRVPRRAVLKSLSVDRMRLLEHVLRERPEERKRLLPYLARMRAYQDECGCAMGGAFGIGALLALLVYALRGAPRPHANVVLLIGAAFLGVCMATVLGKLTGIGIARVRLARLERWLRQHYLTGQG